MDNMVKKKLSAFRKRQTVFVIIYGLINAAVIAGIIVYYRLKEQALAGALYLHDNAYGETFVRKMFSSGITDNNIRAGRTAMESAGYGSHGFSYMSRLNGEMYALIAMIAVLLIALGSGLYNCYRLGHKDFVKKVCDVYADNERLSKQLENEHIYNKEQHRKMQDFIENIAHQIKTPLAIITMKLEMLEEKCDDSSQRKEIADCTGNAFRIKTFIKKLLDISRFEAGKVVMTSDEVDVAAILQESINSSVVDRNRIVMDYGNEKLCMYADEGWIVECFINLLDNCAEYLADDNTKVYVDVTRKNDDCVVTIADNGKGLSTEQFNSIFNRFETNGSAADFKAGIGLNLSKLIIEAHHGSIKAGNSEKYGGAEFVATLPMYRLKTKYQSM